MSRKICVVSGGRADYGLLRGVMERIRAASTLELQLTLTGMHLSPEFGLTFRDVEADGFVIDRKVEMLLSSDTPSGITKSIGVALMAFADAFTELKPDLLLVLGDRFEIFAAVIAALIAQIPVAHLHGGETTEGAFDEALRHSITKMSCLHFVAAEEYRQRVLQLGESPERVFLVGGLGVDRIVNTPLLDRAELEAALRFGFGARNVLVTFHPVTLEQSTSRLQMAELLAALDAVPDLQVIFTLPNADTDGRGLIEMVHHFVAGRSNAQAYAALGQERYLSVLRQVDGVIGNSSSGLTEAPTFGIATINIGDRQRGRLKADSVIDCLPTREAIGMAIERMYSRPFRDALTKVRNPYGDGGASERIVEVLTRVGLTDIVKKSFVDLPHAGRVNDGDHDPSR